ncbi:site-specific DNA-methyltransferase (adenine-specific) [Spirochaetia bacterium]|nr:site-specific DNA-methyltransferase (adenine-specific) [Spirochaetia bacterium]
MPEKNPLIKPYLKWAGGKRQLLPEIRKYFPANINTYYEPFAGAGAALFDLQPERAVINDKNPDLIMTYRVIQNDIEGLLAALEQYRDKYEKSFYYEVRALDRTDAYRDMTDSEKAARFIYMNKTCYNGLYRVNKGGFFNVPFGKYRNPAIFEEPVLRAVHHFLNSNSITILNDDFAAAVINADEHSFIYFDPPYHPFKKSSFTAYQAGGFGEDEQTRLRDVFLELTERGVPCLLSNSDTPFIRELYRDKGFDIISVSANRAINSAVGGRGKIGEVLIRNRLLPG